MTDVGSEFQTDGAVHRKERFAKPVRANGWMSSGVADEHSVRALTRRLMRWLRYCGTDVLSLVCQHRHLVVNSVLNRQPVSLTHQRFGMGPPGCLEDDSGSIVLHTLQLLDAADWRAVEYRVAIVQSRQDQTAGQCLCQIGRQ